MEGERPTKYWTNLHKDCKPRELIRAFKDETETTNDARPVFVSESHKMADMAKQYHMALQDERDPTGDAEQRERSIQTALRAVQMTISAEQAEAMGRDYTWDECETALKEGKTGSSPGLDGLPYELWKTLHERYEADSKKDVDCAFNVVELLTLVFNDIKRYGICEGSSFAEGWMSPIYKEKGERTKISNYRPITLLNTDYKLLTKIMADRLAVVAPSLIHPAQAGFVPGRRLHDHTQLTRMLKGKME